MSAFIAKAGNPEIGYLKQIAFDDPDVTLEQEVRKCFVKMDERLAGDVIGDYSFDREIKTGDRLCFCDMAIYSMVKNNTFNGMPLPDIAVMDENNDCKVIRRFEYEDFKCRLS